LKALLLELTRKVFTHLIIEDNIFKEKSIKATGVIKSIIESRDWQKWKGQISVKWVIL
jgi:hypothetical protein